jgi:hypothetical protein
MKVFIASALYSDESRGHTFNQQMYIAVGNDRNDARQLLIDKLMVDFADDYKFYVEACEDDGVKPKKPEGFFKTRDEEGPWLFKVVQIEVDKKVAVVDLMNIE